MSLRKIALFILSACICSSVCAQTSSRSFEIRYFSHTGKANGETDFKGKTSFLNTDQRVAFLNSYAEYAKLFWNDPSLNKEVVPMDSAVTLYGRIKPQPVPLVRKRVLTDEWKWKGYRINQQIEEAAELQKWQTADGITIADGRLEFNKAAQLVRTVDTQRWRFQLTLNINLSDVKNAHVVLGTCADVGTDGSGRFYYTSNKKRIYPVARTGDKIGNLAFEADFTTRRYNLYADGRLVADYVPFSDTTTLSFNEFIINGIPGLWLDNVTGTGYHKTGNDPHYPYAPVTFVDEDFLVSSALGDWYRPDFDDSGWNISQLPAVHGGERHKNEDLYLRKEFTVADLDEFSSAILNIETLTPSGEIYVNGKIFEVIHNPRPIAIDIRDELKTGKNIIAIKINSYEVGAGEIMTHTSTDRYTGWFAGRIHLDLLKRSYINDVFSYTNNINGSTARQTVKVDFKSNAGGIFKGKLRVSVAPWFPDEGPAVAIKEVAIEATPVIENRQVFDIALENAKLWTAGSPNLYLIKVELINNAGAVIDDYVLTTGVRTISQDGGTFRINGKPELLKAPLLFGMRAPLERIAEWDKCSPAEYIVQEMMMIKRMNANGIRMSIHDSHSGGINDPRFPEIADQLGLMLIWQTTAWLREGNIFSMDFEGLTQYVKQVRNHPSITIWQPSNHPTGWYGWEGIVKSYSQIYKAIIAADSTRLISPSADYRHMRMVPNDEGTRDDNGNALKPDPAWTAPLITRGSMDYMGGYGAEWTTLRKWPFLEKDERPLYYEVNEFQTSFLNSKERAYFNFEHDESAGQPNWSLVKGKPWYLLESYEWDYDTGSIGRRLRFDEWQESQAWQSLIAYESIKKIRKMDYDGLSWCNLRGGANMATYQKPLIDYTGHAKLAFYAHNMGYQSTVAGSSNVDMVYGPGDDIVPLILNIGEKKTVDLTVQLRSIRGKVVESKRFNNIIIEEGRTSRELNPFRFSPKREGVYAIEYIISEVKQ